MVSQNEISSTEKLLDLIKLDKKETMSKASDSNFPIPPPLSPDIGVEPAGSKGRPSRHKEITVGVSIGGNEVILVMVGQTSDKIREIIDYRTVPFSPRLTPESPDFPEFLKSSLKQFCGSPKKAALWCAISSADVEMRRLKIPKVPKKQIANAVYWTYKKEVPFNEKEMIFDFEVLGNITESGLEKIEVTAYTASRREVERLKNIFSKSGFPLTGISILPFGLQNILRSGWIKTGGKGVCNVHLGKNWSRIDILSANGNLALFRGIKTGINSMIDSIREELFESPKKSTKATDDSDEEGDREKAEIPLDLEPETPRTLEQEKAEKIFFNLVNNRATATEESTESVNNEEIILNPIIFSRTIQPVLERLIRQVERTIGHYSVKLGSEGVGRIFVSGEICTSPIIMSDIQKLIDLPIDTFDPFVFGSRFSGPGSLSERVAYMPAAGLALSSNTLTPNFIFTYKEKEHQKKTIRINKSAIYATSTLLALCMGLFLWQVHGLSQGKAQYAEIQDKLDKYNMRIDQQMINDLLPKIKQNTQALKDRTSRYLGMAVLSELSSIEYPNIRLLNVKADMPMNPPEEKTKNKEDRRKKDNLIKVPEKTLTVEGVVLGTSMSFEADLAEYLVALKDSPIFGPPSVIKRAVGIFENKGVLCFTAQMELVQGPEI